MAGCLALASTARGGILQSNADDRGDVLGNPEGRSTHGGAALPPFWDLATDAAGSKVLRYAVRGGRAGAVITVLVPGAFLAFGAHCLIRGSGATAQVSQRAITEIAQRHSPPDPSSPAGSPGTWTTFVAWRNPRGSTEELALAGMGSPEEARWLAAILAKWSGAPVIRGYGAGFEEADRSELPDLGG